MEKLLPETSNGEMNFNALVFAQENPLPISVMIMVDGICMSSVYRVLGMRVTSTREEDAEAKGQEMVIDGKESPMVDATTASSAPLVPIARVDPSEFKIAD